MNSDIFPAEKVLASPVISDDGLYSGGVWTSACFVW